MAISSNTFCERIELKSSLLTAQVNNYNKSIVASPSLVLNPLSLRNSLLAPISFTSFTDSASRNDLSMSNIELNDFLQTFYTKSKAWLVNRQFEERIEQNINNADIVFIYHQILIKICTTLTKVNFF